MNKFETELKNGKFLVSNCTKCNQIVWPPSEICNQCFAPVNWKNISMEGKLLEFSKKDDIVFGIGEFEEKIRIVGTINTNSKNPKEGDKIRLTDYEISNGKQKFSMDLI